MSEVKENKELENVSGGVGGTSNTILCDCGTRFNVKDNQKLKNMAVV